MSNIISDLLSLIDQGDYQGILKTIANLEEIDSSFKNSYIIIKVEILLLRGEIEKAKNELENLGGKIDQTIENLAITTQLAIIQWLKGNMKKAEELIEDAKNLEILENTHPLTNYWKSYMFNASGIIQILLGNPKKAKVELESSYSLAKESNSIRKITSSLDNLAIVHRLLGNFDVAIYYQKEGLKLRQDMGDWHGIALSKGNLAELYEVMGDLEKSLKYSKEIIPLFKEHGTDEEIGMCYHNIGRVYYQLNELQRAEENFNEAYSYRVKSGNKVRLAITMYFKILIAINLQKFQEAGEYLEEFATYPLSETKVIDLNFRLAKAHYIISQGNEMKQAEQILKELIEINDFDIELNLIAMITLIRYYTLTYEKNHREIDKILIQLKKLGHSKNNTILDIELLILEALIALINKNVDKSLEFIERASEEAKKHNFQRILDKVQGYREFIGTNYYNNNEITIENVKNYIDDLMRSFHGY